MAEMCEEIGKGTNWFASVFLALVQKLFGVTERPDSDECELKSTAYEAIAKMIENHPEPARGIVQQMVPEVLARLEKTFETQILSQDDKYQVDRNQALLCATIHMIVRSFDEEQVLPIADQLMEKLLKVLSQRQDTATQEAIMAMGAVADKCGEHFARYLIHVLPFVHQGLQNWEAYQACGQTAGVVGDICRACPAAIAAPEHCDQLMQLLLQVGLGITTSQLQHFTRRIHDRFHQHYL
jgi:importin subunit beta-1